MLGEKPIQNHFIPFAAKFNNLQFKVLIFIQLKAMANAMAVWRFLF